MSKEINDLVVKFGEILKDFPEVRYAGDPVLRQPAQEVSIEEGVKLGKKLGETFINPKIVEIEPPSAKFTKERKVKSRKAGSGSARKKTQKLEGCLSLKDIWGTVLRAPTVKLSYLDEQGQKQEKLFKDFLPTIVQHEYDHLNGVLFPRRALEQKGKLYKSSKDEKGEDIFEELELP